MSLLLLLGDGTVHGTVHGTVQGIGLVGASRVDLPAQTNLIRYARTASIYSAFPSTTTLRHTNQACLRVRVRVGIRVPGRVGGRR